MPSRTEILRSLEQDDYPGLGRYVWQPEAGGLKWSAGLVRIYGRTEAPRSEAEFMACLHPDDRLRVEGETESFLTGSDDCYAHSFRIVRPDGEVRCIVDRARLERDADGRVIAIHGMNMDVTDLPHLAKAVTEEGTLSAGANAGTLSRVLSDRERLEVGQRTTDLALADIDYRAGTFALGPMAARVYGFGDEATTVGRDEIHARFHPEDRARLDAEILRSTDPTGGGSLETEHRIILPDGTIRWLRVQKRIVFATIDGRLRPDRGVLAALDITDRREAEAELQESEERLLLAQSVAGIGVWDVDLQEGRTFWSDGLYDLLQIERGTPPSPDLFFKYVHPDDVTGVRRTFQQAIEEKSRFFAEFRVTLPDGSLKHIVGQGSVTAQRDGRALRILGVNYDVTERRNAELRLKESEAQLRMILDETAGLVGIVHTDGTLREANRAAFELAGLSREDVIGLPFWETPWWTHDPAEVVRLRDAVNRANAGETVRYDARIMAADGSLRAIDFSLSPVFDAEGNVSLLVPSALDITERKKTETQLAEREAQLALFVENAPVAIAMFDREMRYVANSQRYITDFDLPPGIDLTGRLHDEIANEIPDAWRQIHLRTLAGETLSAEEDPFPRASGKTDWVRWRMAPWYDASGEIGGAILFSEIITEQVEARRALKHSETRYKALFESIDAGFCVVEVKLNVPGVGIDYRVVEANPAFYERTGFPKEILGMWLREAAPALEEHWYEIYGGVARTGEPARFEEHSEHLGRWFDVFAFRIDDPEDCRVAILFHDISERKQNEEHVRTLLKEVNHRSKNMLSLVNVIAKRTIGADHGDFLARFSDRIAALAANQDILVHSDWESVELPALVRGQLAHFGDLLDTRIRMDGPALTVFPESAEKLGMALHELATNASKYGALSRQTGCVRISWEATTTESVPQFILTWREEGGPEVIAPSSTGFGSLVSGTILESGLDGSVEADYRSDGLIWTLTCPLANLAMMPDEGPAKPGPRNQDGQKAGILVVDDDPLLAMSVSEVLRDAGFHVVGPARSVERALALIASSPPGLAVLDVNLGRETSERVALELQRLDVPFICVSGYSALQIPEPLQAAPFLSKPLEDETLLKLVRSTAGASRMS